MKIGDIIVSPGGGVTVSCYEITKILDSRPGNVRGKTHLTVESKWCYNGLDFFKGLDVQNTSKSFMKLIGNC